ncbi:DUF3262 family protein [Avibacterium sp. 20-15]|uniref:DUF3262 family protein n=1 Tax=unclassified Avibacterium TaxID=2685287 RepID=UPI0020270E60|nr:MULTISPECIES: DUF3262 family protein [unclassified Avibacterium]MCW9734210.1 DUF3262 family protein [Avibacterium sp. 20-15]URL01418.1 DUF3262 family protein [Avibacterium sp. 20-126]URL03633.1 DUF3262 family protein [Avibacterium sp. 20-132]URL03845.1 DUF3262 family protein [Avibacterium sp. 20-132]
MASDYTPLKAFEIASGLNATELRAFFAIIFVALLLFAYVWAMKKGYSGLFSGFKGDIFDYLKLILKGAAVLIVVVLFFVSER